MSNTFQTNTKVTWKWGNGHAHGYVRNVYREKVTKTLKGTEVSRDGSDENPAYLIEQQDGDQVLKLHSELERSSDQ